MLVNGRARLNAIVLPTCYQISRIGTEGTVPHPTLMTSQNLFLLEFITRRNRPYLNGGVRGACRQVPGKMHSLRYN